MDSVRPLGSPPDLAVDRVEVRPADGGALLVRVLGRGTASGRAILVVPAPARTFRFPPLPASGEGERPAPEGQGWRAAFSVPSELRGALRGNLRLELEGRAVALPAVTEAGDGAPALLADRRADRAERTAQEQSDRADEAEALAADLALRLARAEARLVAAEEDPEGPAARLAALEPELERARQIAFAEGRRREEIEAEAAGRIRRLEEERDALLARLRAARQARDELRGRLIELERARMLSADGTGELARALAETAPPEQRPEGPRTEPARAGPADPAVLRRERELADLATGAAWEPPPAPVTIRGPGAGRAAGAATEAEDVGPAPVDPARLDAARERLRAAAPEEERTEPELRPRGPFARWKARRARRRAARAGAPARRPDTSA
jgi:hypothetical protein